jgi:hypothetical protein
VVDRVGSFRVKWHLSANMKTIKCMNGLQHGPSCKITCIYCEKVHEQVKIYTSAEAHIEAKLWARGAWQGGLFAPRIPAEPCICDATTHSRWKPILPIPLSRTHICTLYAQVRIVKMILHMHFMFMLNMQDLPRKANAIESIERILSTISVEKGNC